MEEPEFLTIGRVLAPWGIRGQMKVEAMTDFPERFLPGHSVYLMGKLFTIEDSRQTNKSIILKLVTIDTVEDSEKLRGQLLEVKLNEIPPLPPDQFYHFQVLGMKVFTEGGELLGEVREIMPTGSNDVYVVHGNRGEILIPAVDDVVKEMDMEQGRIIVEVIEGLLP
ncbi:MAG: ribosome maturation factor RimM [Chloroflexota bacterium]